MSYLRNRPFMVITKSYHPAEGTNTSMKDFGVLGSLSETENMVIVDRVNSNQLSRADLILDLFEQKIVKSRDTHTTGPEASALFEDYIYRYQAEVKSTLARWVAENPENLQKVKDYVAEHEKVNETTDE